MHSLLEIYDSYNFRARISTGIILFAPIILPVYLLIPEIRELSSTLVVLLICFSLCNVLVSCSRTFGTKAKKICFPDMYPAQRMLLSTDATLDNHSKKRYQQFFIEHMNNISFKGTEIDDRETANAAIRWLISRTRNHDKFPLILEETTNFGFACNLYGLKKFGVVINTSLIIIEIIIFYYRLTGKYTAFSTENICLSLLFTFLFLVMWIFMITKTWVIESGEKYALALLAACDSEYFDNSK